MKIVIYSPIPHDGTSFYRAFGPFSNLQRNYYGVEIINGSNEGFEYNWWTLNPVDIVFLQRPSTMVGLHIIKTAKLCNKPVWIDYDDDYISIPTTNPRHNLYANTVRQSQTRECMKLADVITVSTPFIADSIRANVDTKAEIIVIPNAWDPYLFNTNFNGVERKKIVLWRGGDTHVKDVEIYKEAITKCFDHYPEYDWVFYGHEFDWIIDHAILKNQSKRLRLYEFTDLMRYFTNCMQLCPEIMIVPLEDNDFNKAKSNISFIEGTLFGASVMASALPEFTQFGDCIKTFSNNDEFINCFDELTRRGTDIKKALTLIPSLQTVNQKRYEIATKLTAGRLQPYSPKAEKWDDRRFFEYASIHGYIQDNDDYKKGHHSVADWLVNRLNPDSVVEFGCGPGAMLERFLMNNVEAIGLELNEYFVDYFRTRNPVFQDRIMQVDFTGDNFMFSDTDLGVAIEVFEHIDRGDEWWGDFIKKLAKSFKFFYFSSTPYRASVKFDTEWGHVNVRPIQAWIKLFADNGWELIEKPGKICSWDLLFKSKTFAN